MNEYIKQLKEDLEKMKSYDKLYEEIDKKMDDGTATADDEYLAEVYYKKSYNYTEHAVRMIQVLTGGKVEYITARRMVITQADAILKICRAAR